MTTPDINDIARGNYIVGLSCTKRTINGFQTGTEISTISQVILQDSVMMQTQISESHDSSDMTVGNDYTVQTRFANY